MDQLVGFFASDYEIAVQGLQQHGLLFNCKGTTWSERLKALCMKEYVVDILYRQHFLIINIKFSIRIREIS